MRPIPGLRKAGHSPLIRRRTVDLWQSSDYLTQQMFERADIMSEGSTDRALSYYGSTSIVLRFSSEGGSLPDEECADALRFLRSDPHARLRALRLACREAQVRCNAALGKLQAELTFSEVPDGIQINVEVEGSCRTTNQEARG